MNSEVHHSVNVLKFFYGIVPIAAGLDKFFNILVDWEMYVSAPLAGVEPTTLLAIVGIIEIIAGIIVFAKTRIGAYIVSAWLALIAINLLIAGFYDIAVRDLTLAAGAYVLAVLAGSKGSNATEHRAGARQETAEM